MKMAVVQKQRSWDRLRAFARAHQEALAVAVLAVVLLSIGVPYWLRGKAQSAEEAASLLDLGLSYLAQPVDPKQGPLKSHREKWEQALQLFERVRDHYAGAPSADVAIYYAGKCLLLLERPGEALEQFDRAADALEGKALGAQAELGRAFALAAEGKWADAVPEYRSFLARHGEDGFLAAEARLRLAEALEQTGDAAGARRELQVLVEKHPTTWWGMEARRRLEKT